MFEYDSNCSNCGGTGQAYDGFGAVCYCGREYERPCKNCNATGTIMIEIQHIGKNYLFIFFKIAILIFSIIFFIYLSMSLIS